MIYSNLNIKIIFQKMQIKSFHDTLYFWYGKKNPQTLVNFAFRFPFSSFDVTIVFVPYCYLVLCNFANYCLLLVMRAVFKLGALMIVARCVLMYRVKYLSRKHIPSLECGRPSPPCDSSPTPFREWRRARGERLKSSYCQKFVLRGTLLNSQFVCHMFYSHSFQIKTEWFKS